jgi:hypothetical protein
VWATDTERDVVVRLDSADRQVVDTIPTGHDPTGVAVGGGGVWVANSGAGTVSWINSAALATAHDSRAFGVVALTDSRVLWAAVSFAPGTMVLAWPRGRVRFTSADDGNACVEAGDERWRLDRILPTKAVDELLDQLSNCGSVGEAVSVAAK